MDAASNKSSGADQSIFPARSSTTIIYGTAIPGEPFKKATSKADGPIATGVEEDSNFGSKAPSATIGEVSGSSSPTQRRKNTASGVSNAGACQSYFESFRFWVHAAGTIVIAMFVGLQVV
jgi:hypothetical protein